MRIADIPAVMSGMSDVTARERGSYTTAGYRGPVAGEGSNVISTRAYDPFKSSEGRHNTPNLPGTKVNFVGFAAVPEHLPKLDRRTRSSPSALVERLINRSVNDSDVGILQLSSLLKRFQVSYASRNHRSMS